MPSDNSGWNKDYEAALDRSENVVSLPANLPDAEYRRVLSEAHFALLPYHPESYKDRGSGVAWDALGLGTPCIVRAGTAIADSIVSSGAGFAYANTAALLSLLVAHIERHAMDYWEYLSVSAKRASDMRVLANVELIVRIAHLHQSTCHKT